MSTTFATTAARTMLNRTAATGSAKTKTNAFVRSFGTSAENLVKTALYDLHKELGGDMVPFAGYELPVLYKGGDNGGVMKEHLWCRADGKAALFDVSHMGQVSCCCIHFLSKKCLIILTTFQSMIVYN